VTAARETPITELTIARDVPARMRDGVVLRANVYRPAIAGPWPTLLTRTPYGKDLPGAAAWLDPVRAAGAGFIVIVQDVRGRFASDGDWEPFLHESSDGFDTVQWAARLPGGNGRVGMFGLSYWGNTQWLAAIARPPSLCAIAPGLTWCDPDDGLLRRGGALQFGMGVVWGLEQGIDYLRRRREAPERVDARIRDLLDELDGLAETGLWRLPASTARVLADHGLPGLDHGRAGAGTASANACRVAGRHHRVQVPVLGIGGWHDAFIQGVLDNHAAMAALGRDSQLVIGPWSHANFSDTIGALGFGTRARKDGGPAGGPDDVTAIQLAWFRRHLDPHAGAEPQRPPVRVFVMGANRWRDEPAWPPPGVTQERWYLRAGGGLSTTPPRADEGVSEFVYDPADPVPSDSARTPTATPEPLGPAEQSAIESRPDVLVFTSDPLGDDLEVAGRVRVVVHARSSAPSTDWVARVCDVYPDGRSYGLCDGIVRVGGRADEPRCHEVDLWSTCNLFRRGHRLRVHITSSSFPRWDRNLNTGRQDEARHVPACQRIDHDADHPSWLELVVRPPRRVL
jgi:putative CocE/NonD family hydrolase